MLNSNEISTLCELAQRATTSQLHSIKMLLGVDAETRAHIIELISAPHSPTVRTPICVVLDTNAIDFSNIGQCSISGFKVWLDTHATTKRRRQYAYDMTHILKQHSIKSLSQLDADTLNYLWHNTTLSTRNEKRALQHVCKYMAEVTRSTKQRTAVTPIRITPFGRTDTTRIRFNLQRYKSWLIACNINADKYCRGLVQLLKESGLGEQLRQLSTADLRHISRHLVANPANYNEKRTWLRKINEYLVAEARINNHL